MIRLAITLLCLFAFALACRIAWQQTHVRTILLCGKGSYVEVVP